MTDNGVSTDAASLPFLMCKSGPVNDGMGAAFLAGAGLVVATAPKCESSSGAGFVLARFDQNGALGEHAVHEYAQFSVVELPPSGALGTMPYSDRFILSFSAAPDEGSLAGYLQPVGEQFVSADQPLLKPHMAQSGELAADSLATSADRLARITWEWGGSSWDWGAASISVEDSSAWPLKSLGAQQLGIEMLWPPAIAVSNRRVFAAGLTSLSPAAITLSELDATSGLLAPVALQLETQGDANRIALAPLGEFLMLALSSPGEIRVARIARPRRLLAPRISSFARVQATGFDGLQFAMAGARNRVAIAWVSKAAAPGFAPGGWALLECEQ